MKLIKISIRILSILWPALAASLAFDLFQRTRRKPPRKREQSFYSRARHFTVPNDPEAVDAYELGNPEGKLVILIHGWDSNAGSMAKIAFALADRGYRVVAFNLPAHGSSKLRKSNLLVCYQAFRSLLEYLKPAQPFSLVTHSFGSAAATFTLSKLDYAVDDFVMLTSPNRLIDIFDEYRDMIGLGKKAYTKLLQLTQKLLGESIRGVNVAALLNRINIGSVAVIHDRQDRVITFDTALDIVHGGENRKLIAVEGVGHYRMLWDEKVIQLALAEISGETRRIPELAT